MSRPRRRPGRSPTPDRPRAESRNWDLRQKAYRGEFEPPSDTVARHAGRQPPVADDRTGVGTAPPQRPPDVTTNDPGPPRTRRRPDVPTDDRGHRTGRAEGPRSTPSRARRVAQSVHPTRRGVPRTDPRGRRRAGVAPLQRRRRGAVRPVAGGSDRHDGVRVLRHGGEIGDPRGDRRAYRRGGPRGGVSKGADTGRRHVGPRHRRADGDARRGGDRLGRDDAGRHRPRPPAGADDRGPADGLRGGPRGPATTPGSAESVADSRPAAPRSRTTSTGAWRRSSAASPT